MNENDFHDREHRWRGNGHEQMKCWCEPFYEPLHPDLDPKLFSLLVLHRPDYGFVYWSEGEQGPMPAVCWSIWKNNLFQEKAT